MSNQNFDLMLSNVKAPPTPEIKPAKRPSFGKFEQATKPADPFVDLSNRVVEEPETAAHETMQRPRFNSDDDWMKGSKIYEQFAIKADLRKKPQFNSGC